MFEKFISQSAESFRQRYEGTFGFYKDESNKRMLVKLNSIRETRCDFVNAEGVTYNLYPDSPREIGFEFLPPKSQWYNTEDGAVVTRRIAARQFQRGISGKNIEVFLLKGILYPMKVDFRTLSSIYESPVKPKDAVEAYLKDKVPSLAISGQFALTQDSVYLFNDVIGKFKVAPKERKFSFTLEEPQLWRTEINDAINALNCSAEIS